MNGAIVSRLLSIVIIFYSAVMQAAPMPYAQKIALIDACMYGGLIPVVDDTGEGGTRHDSGLLYWSTNRNEGLYATTPAEIHAELIAEQAVVPVVGRNGYLGKALYYFSKAERERRELARKMRAWNQFRKGEDLCSLLGGVLSKKVAENRYTFLEALATQQSSQRIAQAGKKNLHVKNRFVHEVAKSPMRIITLLDQVVQLPDTLEKTFLKNQIQQCAIAINKDPFVSTKDIADFSSLWK